MNPPRRPPSAPRASSALPERLRRETHELHRSAERSRFMAALLRGRVSRPPYSALLRNLHAIYSALEPALERHRQHPWIAPVILPALWRSAALAADLAELHGAGWADALVVLPAAERYCARVRQLDAAQPGLLLAHAYVRCLGDLSGGQLLRRIVAESLQLTGGVGTAFYDFGAPSETLALARAFRSGLDEVSVDAPAADSLVAEAVLAFELHHGLFDELAVAFNMTGDAQAVAAGG
jgi:heme oxygenase (biliverdin-producing, ferredoxin)